MLNLITSTLARTEDDSRTADDINRDVRIAAATQVTQFQFATR